MLKCNIMVSCYYFSYIFISYIENKFRIKSSPKYAIGDVINMSLSNIGLIVNVIYTSIFALSSIFILPFLICVPDVDTKYPLNFSNFLFFNDL